MRATTRHLYPLGLDLASLRVKDNYVNPELAILKVKLKQWKESGKGLSFEEFLLTEIK